MWLSRCLQLIEDRNPAILWGDGEWGIPYLIAALEQPQCPLVWVELDLADRHDPILQGNKLAEALARATGKVISGYGMPLGYVLTVFRSRIGSLDRLTLALSGAEHSPGLAQDLAQMASDNFRVVLHYHNFPLELPTTVQTQIIGPPELALRLEEASSLAANTLDSGNLQSLLRQSGGAFERFVASLSPGGRSGLNRPSSQQHPAQSQDTLPQAHFLSLMAQHRWLEALDVALTQYQPGLEQVVEEASRELLLRGTPHLLLEKLRGHQSPGALRYQLLAAIELGREGEYLGQVEQVLQSGEFPGLRAVYAEILLSRGLYAEALYEARRAVALRDFQTVLSYSKVLQAHNPVAGVEESLAALNLAERSDHAFDQARAALTLAHGYILMGEYPRALEWVEYGLHLFHRKNLANWILRLDLLNYQAFIQMLTTAHPNPGQHLEEELRRTPHLHPRQSWLFRCTLADIDLSEGRMEQAVSQSLELWQTVDSRSLYAIGANRVARALLEVHRFEEATQYAERALLLSETLAPLFARRCGLALGLVQALTRPREAVLTLLPIFESFLSLPHGPRTAQAGLYLARAQLSLGLRTEALETLARARFALAQLSPRGLRYLAGPQEVFDEVFTLIGQETPNLELHFLGQNEVRYLGQPVELRRRQAEILLLLTLNPQGLDGEQLALALYGEQGNSASAKSDISRLRSLIPIESRPYRLATTVWADYLQLQKRVQEGRITEALDLYRGALLPESQAPAIVEERQVIEETLRLTVLAQGDAEAIFQLAQHLGHDLEAWETAERALPAHDPRRSQAQAQANRIRREWASHLA